MQTKAPYDARAVANFLLDLADSRRHSLTQLSVLKLIYFAHGWYLADTSQPFVTQDFEAWKKGPVIKVVRDEFKHFGDQPITDRASRLDIYSGQRHYVHPDLAVRDKQFVEAIYDGYHEFDAWQLSEMTHEPDSPWYNIWESEVPVGRLALRIKNEDIESFFCGLPRRFLLS